MQNKEIKTQFLTATRQENGSVKVYKNGEEISDITKPAMWFWMDKPLTDEQIQKFIEDISFLNNEFKIEDGTAE